MLAKTYSILKPASFRYFSLAATAESNYSNFRSAYVQNLSKFQETLEEVEESENVANLKARKAWSHPYNNEHSRVNVSPSHTSELFFEFVGPEQVSPHYESFLVSRKWAIGFWTTCFTLSFFAQSVDFHWVAQSSIVPFVYYTSIYYWVVEMRKFYLKP